MSSTIVIIIISLLFSAFFSGMEIAFVSSNKLRFEMDKQRKTLTSSILNIFYTRPDRYISTILVGNNIALVIYGIQMANLLRPFLILLGSDALIALIQTLLSTFLILITGEFIPKILFKINSNFWMNTFAVPLLLIYVILYPISVFMSFLSKAIIRLFGIKVAERSVRMLGRVDLDFLVHESVHNHNNNKDEINNEVKIFQNALDFSKVKLRDCMVPRTEIEAVDSDTGLEELTQRFVLSGCSKILVYKDSIDNIIGYIHSIEMYKNPTKWQDKIILIPIVPETMAANKLMNLLLLKKKSLAVVVDEFGGTAGIVTLEDIVEEIFGEIEDEHDTQEYVEKRINEHELILSGRLEVDYINEQFGLELPTSDEYITIAGLILHIYQGFPKTNDEIKSGNYLFKVLKVTHNKIELVRLIIQ
ncbi:MAG: HlyC/CorC family transporter [Bacteroidia bacterium]|nr:HlyC/CorC family transporter [Bacteroidia bacterium]